MSRVAILVVGLFAFVMLCLVCVWARAGAIEDDIFRRTDRALVGRGIDWVEADVDGRELIVTGTAPTPAERARAEQILGRITGIRRIESRLASLPPAPAKPPSPFRTSPALPAGLARANPPTPAGPPRALSPAAPRDDGPLTPVECQARLDELLGLNRILFEGGIASVSPRSDPVLDSLATVLARCSEAIVEIAGHTAGPGDEDFNLKLSRLRARAVAGELARRGVEADRIFSQGYGESRPVADDSTLTGRTRNDRIEILVRRKR